MRTKTILCLLLIAFIQMPLLAQTYSGGSGTEGDPYQIATKADLKYLSENTGEWSKHFIQTADINFLAADFEIGGDFYNSGEGFNPIGKSSPYFTGSYDGDNYTIDGLYVNISTDYGGLFGYVYSGAEVANINLTNVDITASQHVGALCGRTYNNDIDNCSVSGSVVGNSQYVGGLIGYVYSGGTVTNCESSVDVTGGSSYYTGGLIGYNKAVVTNCSSSGTVTGSGYYVGGLIGYNYYSTIKNCTTSNSVSSTNYHTGGLIGYNYNAIIQNCSSSCSVSSTGQYTGGLVGRHEDGTIEASFSTGSVTSANKYTGGLVGRSEGAVIRYCYSTSDVDGGSSDYAGGLVGANYSTDISKSFASGSVSGNNNVGGLTGYHYYYYSYGYNKHIVDCYSTGAVTGSSNVGGLTGYQSSAYTNNCYSVSTVSGSSSVGALAGYCSSSSSYVTDCFYNTDIYATSNGGTGKTTAEMKTESTFSDAGWSMGGVWEIDETEATNSGYPYMLWTEYSGDGPLIQAGNISTSSVTSSSMDISWNNGGGDARAVFIKAASSGTAVPVDNTTYTANTAFGSGDQIGTSGWYCIYNGTGTSVSVSNLNEVTEYTIHVCEYYGEAGSEKYRICGNTDNPKTSATLPQASEPTLGDGSEGNPYQISNLNELFWISESTTRWSYHYIQTANIDASSTSLWFDGDGWNPIGNSSTRFTGSYDGGGYTIDGLSMNQPSHDYNGLFGYINTGAELKNITLTNVDIMADEYTGALVGKMYQATVSNCSSSGSVEVDYRYVGGLVGWNDEGLIKGSNSSANVTGGSSGYTGGLVGYNDYGTIQDAFSTGAVSGVYDYTGGLVGQNYNGLIQVCYSTGNVSSSDGYTGGIAGKSEYGTIRYSYSTSDVDGGSNSYTGGLVGYNNYAKIDKSYYAEGTVSSTGNYTGGLVGQHYYNTGDLGYITDSYSTGTVNGAGYVGGIAGQQYYSYTDNCYSVSSLTGSSSVGGVSGYCSSTSTYSTDCFYNTDIYASSSGGTGKTTAEMKTESTFSDAGWDIGVVWLLDGTLAVNNGYPYLAWSEYSGTAPLIQASNIVATNLTGESMTLTWANGNGDYRAVFIKETNTGTAVPANNTSYIANSEFGSGDQIGTTGWYCVYNGTGNTVDITGLDEITEYTVYVSEYFGESGSEDYRLCQNTDNPKTIATPPLSTQPAGDGTESNPYQIASLANLYWIAEDHNRWDKHYLQTADIDAAATSAWFSNQGWDPIGYDNYEFSGSYNGQNYSISNLFIDRDEQYIGLFGKTEDQGSVISNVNLVNVDITGGLYTGALLGRGYATKVYTCSSSGTVNGAGQTGGLVGDMYYGRVINCNSNATVISTDEYTGGLVGYNQYGDIRLSYASGDVTGTTSVGGLAGDKYNNSNKGYVENCYSNGTVTGTSTIGGLIGEQWYSYSYIVNCYSVATLGEGGSTKGGLTGSCINALSYITASFFNTDIFPTSASGEGKTTAELKNASTYINEGWDFDGETDNGNKDYWKIDAGQNNGYPVFTWQGESSTYPTIQACDIYLSEISTTGFTLNWGNGNGDARVVFIKETNSGTTMPVDNTTYSANTEFGAGDELGTGWYCVYNGKSHTVSITGLTMNKTYMIQVFEYNGNPGSELYLNSESYNNPKKDFTYPIEPIEPTGDGSSGSPFQIASLENLFWYNLNFLSNFGWVYLEQTADIDASGTSTWYDGAGWSPIGQRYVTKYFYLSEYDGQGHKITGLHINRPDEDYVGLFGYGYRSDFKDLGLEDVNITGGHMTGALIGDFSGSSYDARMENCYSTGNIYSDKNLVGGLVGNVSTSVVEYCYSTCDVSIIDFESSTSNSMGGLVGDEYGRLRYCYATGDVHGYEEVGGLVGSNYNTSYCFSTGNVTGYDYVGGFAGAGPYGGSSTSQCYSTGNVICSTHNHGGFSGRMNSGSSNCFYNVDNDLIFYDVSGDDNNGATGKSTTEMLQQSTYTDASWDFASTWAIDSDYNNGYPYLQNCTPQQTVKYTWTGNIDTDWNTAGNWDKNEVPPMDAIVFVPDVVNDLSISSCPCCQCLTIGSTCPLEITSEINVSGVFALNNDLNLNGQEIVFGENGSLEESHGKVFGSSGCIKTTRTLNDINENIAGFGLELTTSENMGETTIERTHKGILAEENDGVLRVFKISPTNNSGLNATMVFHYYESELNGNDENTLVLYKSSDEGQTWVEVGGTVDTDENTVTLAGIDGFSWWTLAKAGETLLPVEFLSFSGNYITKDQVQLNWKTATEKNNSHFIIERSENALNLTQIDKVEGAGNSVSEKQYKYVDRNATASGYYYRIKQVDMDGKYSYSGKIWVSQNATSELVQIQAFPNPFTNSLSISVDNENGNTELEILDVKGNVVWSNSSNETNLNVIRTDAWKPGLYILKCKINEKIHYHKIIKK